MWIELQYGVVDEEEPHRQAYIAVVGGDYEVMDICTTGVHNSRHMVAKVGPSIAGLTVHMELLATVGSGSAVFSNNNAAAIDIAADTNLVLRGIQYSTVLSNMELRASYAGYEVRARKFTIRDMRDLETRRAFAPSSTVLISTA